MFMREFVSHSKTIITRLTNTQFKSNKDNYQAVYLENQITLAEINDILAHDADGNTLSQLITLLSDRWDRIKDTDANYCHNHYGIANQVCMALAKEITDLVGGDPNVLLMPTLETTYTASLRGAVMSDDNKTCIDVFACLDQMKRNNNKLLHTHPVNSEYELSDAEKFRVINFSPRSQRYYQDLQHGTLKMQYKSRNNLQKQITSPNQPSSSTYKESGWERLEQHLYYLWDDYENLIASMSDEARDEWLYFMSDYRDFLAHDAGFYDDEEEYRPDIANMFADEEREELLASEPVEGEYSYERLDNFSSETQIEFSEENEPFEFEEDADTENEESSLGSEDEFSFSSSKEDTEEQDAQEREFLLQGYDSSSADEFSLEEPYNESIIDDAEDIRMFDEAETGFDMLASRSKKKYFGKTEKEKEKIAKNVANDGSLAAKRAINNYLGVHRQHAMQKTQSSFSVPFSNVEVQENLIVADNEAAQHDEVYSLRDLFNEGDYSSSSEKEEESSFENDYSSSSGSEDESSANDYSSSSESDDEGSENDYLSSSESEEESDSENEYSSYSESEDESSTESEYASGLESEDESSAEDEYSSSSESDEESNSENEYSSSSESEEEISSENQEFDNLENAEALFCQRLHELKQPQNYSHVENPYWINPKTDKKAKVYSLKYLFKGDSDIEEQENSLDISDSEVKKIMPEKEAISFQEPLSKGDESSDDEQEYNVSYSEDEEDVIDSFYADSDQDDESAIECSNNVEFDDESLEKKASRESGYLSEDSSEEDYFEIKEPKMKEDKVSHYAVKPSLSIFSSSPAPRQFDAKSLTDNKFILMLMNADRSDWLDRLRGCRLDEIKDAVLKGRTLSATINDSSIYTGNETHDRSVLFLLLYVYRAGLIHRESKFNAKSYFGAMVSSLTSYDTSALTGFDRDTKLAASLLLLNFLLSENSLLDAEASINSLCNSPYYKALTQLNSDLGTLTAQTIAVSKQLSQFEPVRSVKLNASGKGFG